MKLNFLIKKIPNSLIRLLFKKDKKAQIYPFVTELPSLFLFYLFKIVFFYFVLTGRSGYQAANHRSPSDWATRTPLRRALCSQGSRVLRQEQGLQTTLTLDHGHHEPPGRVTSRARPQVEPEVRDRSAVQDAEHRTGLTTTWEPPKSGCSDSKLWTQVSDAACYQPGNGLCTYFFTFLISYTITYLHFENGFQVLWRSGLVCRDFSMNFKFNLALVFQV